MLRCDLWAYEHSVTHKTCFVCVNGAHQRRVDVVALRKIVFVEGGLLLKQACAPRAAVWIRLIFTQYS